MDSLSLKLLFLVWICSHSCVCQSGTFKDFPKNPLTTLQLYPSALSRENYSIDLNKLPLGFRNLLRSSSSTEKRNRHATDVLLSSENKEQVSISSGDNVKAKDPRNHEIKKMVIKVRYILKYILEHPVFFSWLSTSDVDKLNTNIRAIDFSRIPRAVTSNTLTRIQNADKRTLELFGTFSRSESDASVPTQVSNGDRFAELVFITNSIHEQISSAQFSLDIIHDTLEKAYPNIFSRKITAYDLVNDILNALIKLNKSNAKKLVGFGGTKFDICPVNNIKVSMSSPLFPHAQSDDQFENINVPTTAPSPLEEDLEHQHAVTSENLSAGNNPIESTNYNTFSKLTTEATFSETSATIGPQEPSYGSTHLKNSSSEYPDTQLPISMSFEMTSSVNHSKFSEKFPSSIVNADSSDFFKFPFPSYLHSPNIFLIQSPNSFNSDEPGSETDLASSTQIVDPFIGRPVALVSNNYNFDINIDSSAVKHQSDDNVRRTEEAKDLYKKLTEMIDMMKGVFKQSESKSGNRNPRLRHFGGSYLFGSTEIDEKVLNFILSVVGENLLYGRSYVQQGARKERMVTRERLFPSLLPKPVFPYNSRKSSIPSFYHNLDARLSNLEATPGSVDMREQKVETNTAEGKKRARAKIFNPGHFNQEGNFKLNSPVQGIPESFLQSFYENYSGTPMLPILVPYPVPVSDWESNHTWALKREQVTIASEPESTHLLELTTQVYETSSYMSLVEESQSSLPGVQSISGGNEEQMIEASQHIQLTKENESTVTVIPSSEEVNSEYSKNGKHSKLCRRKYLKTIASLKRLSRHYQFN